LLVSLKLGNMGINLKRANYVFFRDLWWNPFVLEQAENRSHRHGQKHDVHIVYFVTDHTIELYMMKLLEAKRNKLQSIASAEESLNEEEQKALFDYKIVVEM
jgi:SNF2 family DNA or RNA helicase